MNLIIDQGNTICKLAVCSEEAIIEVYSASQPTRELLTSILREHPSITDVIYSSVGRWNDDTPSMLEELVGHLHIVSADTRVPLAIEYERSRLGSDRLAAVVGAYLLSAGREMLVLDAGTAITYERISASGVYLGGNISPGLYVRLKALHSFTSRLPLVDEVDEMDGFGHDTASAMKRGAALGLAYEVDGYINELRRQHPSGIVYLTGGDADILAEMISGEVIIEPNLVLLGLNKILEYNKGCHKE